MTDTVDTQSTNGPVAQKPSGRGSVTFAVLGVLFLVAGFAILYRAERTNNKSWIAARADSIDPKKPGEARGMVRFNGMPEGALVDDGDSGKKFVYLSKTRYEFAPGDGKSPGPDWKRTGGSVETAKDLRVGAVRIRLDEADIMGRHVWSVTILRPERGGGSPPRIGDVKIEVSGIPSDTPLFCVGNLSGGYLGKGRLFVVSAYSEGKTLDELKEFRIWRWFRNPLCFTLLLIGFAFLGRPFMDLVKAQAHRPAVQPLAKIGWVPYLVIAAALSWTAVKFSYYTADLLWLVIALAVGVPAAVIILRMKAKK